MINLTPYTFHPITCGFIKLLKNIRTVSTWLTFTVGNICCLCCEAMFTESIASASYKSTNRDIQVLSSPIVDAGKSSGEPLTPHRVAIDFSPRPEDTVEVQQRCVQFLKLIDGRPHGDSIRDTMTFEEIPEESSVCSSKSKGNMVTSEYIGNSPTINSMCSPCEQVSAGKSGG